MRSLHAPSLLGPVNVSSSSHVAHFRPWMSAEEGGEGEWYQLHDYNQRVEGKPVSFGAVRLKLFAADSDKRRVLYNQPLLEDPDERPAGMKLGGRP